MLGHTVMTPPLDELRTSLLYQRVPGLWRRASYPSTKPLGPWVRSMRPKPSCLLLAPLPPPNTTPTAHSQRLEPSMRRDHSRATHQLMRCGR